MLPWRSPAIRTRVRACATAKSPANYAVTAHHNRATCRRAAAAFGSSRPRRWPTQLDQDAKRRSRGQRQHRHRQGWNEPLSRHRSRRRTADHSARAEFGQTATPSPGTTSLPEPTDRRGSGRRCTAAVRDWRTSALGVDERVTGEDRSGARANAGRSSFELARR